MRVSPILIIISKQQQQTQMSSSNFSMTAEEQAIYNSAFKDAILPEDSEESYRLHLEWKAKEKTIESNELLPLADILYDIIRNVFISRKDELMTELQNKIKTTTHRHNLSVKLFRFNSVEWNESLSDKKKRLSLMTLADRNAESEQDIEHFDKIKKNHWDWSLGTQSSYGGYDDIPFPYKKQARISRIIKKTPILHWLSGMLGPNYQCVLESKFMPPENTDLDYYQDFYVYQNTIRIVYLPYGYKNKTKLLQIAKDCNEKNSRTSYKLSRTETLYGNGSWDLKAMTDILKDC